MVLFASHSSAVLVPRVCDACKETDENDNEIVDNLCKNDFGKSAHAPIFVFFRAVVPQVKAQGPQVVMKEVFPGDKRTHFTVGFHLESSFHVQMDDLCLCVCLCHFPKS